jgi:hypothetical protein
MEIETSVLAALSSARMNGPHLVIEQQLDRHLYVRVNKVLMAAGGRWNSRAKAHVFEGDAAERMEQVILTGSVVVPKDEFEFFETPAAVVDRVLEEARVRGDMRVLEPSAGRGALLSPLRGLAVIDAIEKMPANAAFLRSCGWIADVHEGDFLAVEPKPVYDRVLMNPPFSRQQDVKHVLHALGFLAPGGRLVAVMSAGAHFRTDRLATEFRGEVERRGGVIEPLPDQSFKSSGTCVNTVLVTVDQD